MSNTEYITMQLECKPLHTLIKLRDHYWKVIHKENDYVNDSKSEYAFLHYCLIQHRINELVNELSIGERSFSLC